MKDQQQEAGNCEAYMAGRTMKRVVVESELLLVSRLCSAKGNASPVTTGCRSFRRVHLATRDSVSY